MYTYIYRTYTYIYRTQRINSVWRTLYLHCTAYTTMYTVRTLYGVHLAYYTLYTVQSIVYIVPYTSYTSHCMLYIVHIALLDSILCRTILYRWYLDIIGNLSMFYRDFIVTQSWCAFITDKYQRYKIVRHTIESAQRYRIQKIVI